MNRPHVVVFASGKKNGPQGYGGGSGFENLVEATKTGMLDAKIVAVLCNREGGEVHERAERLGIPYIYFDGPYTSEGYSSILQKTAIAEEEIWVALSGWLKPVQGLDPRRTFNIHPALLSQLGGRFGGHGMYGRKVHEAVKAALDAGEISESGFTMHFVTDEMDRGPIFYERRVPLAKGMSVEDIERHVRKAEHEWQPKITNLVVHGKISWDGTDPKTLVKPAGLDAPSAL